MKVITLVLSLTFMILALGASRAHADLILDEKFDGPTIDPAWVFKPSTDYSSSDVRIDQGRLYVGSIVPTFYGPNNGFAYAGAQFTRSFSPVGDFSAELDLSWRQSEARYMIRSQVVITDAQDNVIGGLFVEDGWANPADASGSGYWTLYANNNVFAYNSGRIGTSNWNRDLTLSFSRTGDTYSALINGSTQVIGSVMTSPATKVSILLGFYAYNGNVGFGSSLSSPQWVDRVLITAPVPEPSSFAMIALGGMAIVGMKRLRSHR